MKTWLLAATLALSSLAPAAILTASAAPAKRMKVTGQLTGRLALWPRELITVALMPEAEADRLGAKVRADDLKRIKTAKAAASLSDKALRGTFEFPDVAAGRYRVVVFKSCAASSQEDAAVLGRVEVEVDDQDVTVPALKVNTSAEESSRRMLQLGAPGGSTPCGELIRKDEKPAKGAPKGKTVVGAVVASSPMPAAGNVSAYLIEIEARKLDSGLELESRVLVEREKQPVLAAGNSGRFEFSGVQPGTYRLEVREVRQERCIYTPIGIGQEDVHVDLSDVSVEMQVKWLPKASASTC